VRDYEPIHPISDEDAAILKAKYHDYCSAQLADLLLFLTPDEIYLLAQRAARESGQTGKPTYDRIVEVAARWLSKKVRLPPFEVWAADYQAHPERYEEYLMGLWKSEVPAAKDW